jgi:hypothetical protein
MATQKKQEENMNMNKAMRICVVLVPVFVALLAMGCCPGKGKLSPEKSGAEEEAATGTAKIGETIVLGDSEFKVLEAIKKDSLSHYTTGELKKGTGFFIEVHGSYTNNGSGTKTIEVPLVVYDSKNRKVESMEEQDDYLPDAYLSLWTDVKSKETLKFGALFEVPADAAGLKLEVHDLGNKSAATRLVDLGI